MSVRVGDGRQLRVVGEAVSAATHKAVQVYEGISEMLPPNHPAVMSARQDLIDHLRTMVALVNEQHRKHVDGAWCGTPDCDTTPEKSKELSTYLRAGYRAHISKLIGLQDDCEKNPMDQDQAIGMAIGRLAAMHGTDPTNLL